MRSNVKPIKNKCDTIVIRVLGDGKRYKFTVRTNDEFDGVNYQQSFVTVAKKWQTIKLPLREFKATYHGRLLKNKPSLIADKIFSLGFLISDKQEGPFQLKIDWIQAINI